jgi:hypothetical protein
MKPYFDTNYAADFVLLIAVPGWVTMEVGQYAGAGE